MLTKKQRWRRVRVVRSNNTSGSSSSGSSDISAEAEGFASFPTMGSSCNDSFDINSDSTTPPPPASPPLPPQQQTSLQPRDSSLRSNHAAGAQTMKPPMAFAPQGEQEQRQHQHRRQQQQQHNDNPFAAGAAQAPHHRHPLEACKISALNLIKLVFLFDASGFGGWGDVGANRDRSATEGCHTFGAAGAARPRRPSEPTCRSPRPLPPSKAVRFSHQIRVILVASRIELSSMKTDIWWGERDYCDFRRAYCRAAREKKKADREVVLQRNPGPGITEEEESDIFRRPCCRVSAFSRPATSTSNSAGRACVAVGAVAVVQSSCLPSRTSPQEEPAAVAAPHREGNDGDDGGPLSKSSCGEDDACDRGDGGHARGEHSQFPRGAPVPSPTQPPPSPKSQPGRPRAEGDDSGMSIVGVQRPLTLLGSRHVGTAEEEGGAKGCGTANLLDELCAQDGGPAATSAAAGAAVAASTAVSRGGADPAKPRPQPSQGGSDGEVTAPVDAAIDIPEGFEPARGVDPVLDLASVARGFPWRASRAEAAVASAERSPGSCAAPAATKAASASSRDHGSRRKSFREDTMLMLKTGVDLQIDPRTAGRTPLPFLGEERVRRVASL